MREIYNLYNKLDKEVHVWKLDINKKNYHFSISNKEILDVEEINKFNAYVCKTDKKTFVISHILLRYIIKSYISIPLNEIKLYCNEYKKPYLVNRDITRPLYFNISHSNTKILIAISNLEIGIDIEYIRDNIDIYSIMKYIGSNREYEEFQSLSSYTKQLDYFYLNWTQKEAILKCSYIGLLDKFSRLDLGAKEKSIIKYNKETYCIHILRYYLSYKVALSYKSSKYKIIKVNYWSRMNYNSFNF